MTILRTAKDRTVNDTTRYIYLHTIHSGPLVEVRTLVTLTATE